MGNRSVRAMEGHIVYPLEPGAQRSVQDRPNRLLEFSRGCARHIEEVILQIHSGSHDGIIASTKMMSRHQNYVDFIVRNSAGEIIALEAKLAPQYVASGELPASFRRELPQVSWS